MLLEPLLLVTPGRDNLVEDRPLHGGPLSEQALVYAVCTRHEDSVEVREVHTSETAAFEVQREFQRCGGRDVFILEVVPNSLLSH